MFLSLVNFYRPTYRFSRYFGGKRVNDSIILVVCLALALPAATAIAQNDSAGSFDLTVDPQDRVSLTANNASLEAIVSQLGKDLGIEVAGALSEDRRVTAQIANVSVAEALRQIGDSYVLIEDAQNSKARKIILLGKGKDGEMMGASDEQRLAGADSENNQGGFQFEFDPSSVPVSEPEAKSTDSESDRQ